MGFFSSRKAEDNDSYQITLGSSAPDRSMVKVIRSRFYGKKGKEREEQPVGFISNTTSAQILSNPTPPTLSISSQHHVGRTAGPSTPVPRKSTNDHSLPPTPTSTKFKPDKRPPPTPSRTSIASEVPTTKSTTVASPRKGTDTVTVTLAQRLNELAVANSEGLLNDDEYRILRQNLFERFASNAAVPTEASVVPASSPVRAPPKKDSQTRERPQSRVISNFQVERPLSITSKASVGSEVANLFRRATGRRSSSRDPSDASSVWSATSNTSNIFRLPRMLSKKSSNSSIRTAASQQADTVSISSRRVGSERGDTTITLSPSNRSMIGSVRKLATPPSSFPTRAITQDARKTNSIYNVFDEENLTTVKEITQEIANVEAEVRRLMDAFNGLEVTTLAKNQRHHIRPSLKSADFGRAGPESVWGDSDGRSQRRINLADDAISMQSATSAGTTPSVSASVARSGYSTKKSSRLKGATGIGASSSLNPMNSSRPGSLHRKNSSSSVTSDRRGNSSNKMNMAPPVPALPNSIYLKGNTSNISLVRSANHLPMNTVPEDEKASDFGTMSTLRMDVDEVENEMDDIRRRREEVQQRYDARLEYLRAKLKGAQLHERLARK